MSADLKKIWTTDFRRNYRVKYNDRMNRKVEVERAYLWRHLSSYAFSEEIP